MRTQKLGSYSYLIPEIQLGVYSDVTRKSWERNTLIHIEILRFGHSCFFIERVGSILQRTVRIALKSQLGVNKMSDIDSHQLTTLILKTIIVLRFLMTIAPVR